MKDVARLAGTSKATVSNVLAGHPHVRPETRDRVLAAAKTLGYHVNVSARALARQRTSVLGLVVGSLQNPWYVPVVARIERHARERGHAVLMVSTWGDLSAQASGIRTLIEHRVAAIIFLSTAGNAVVRSVPSDIPIVFVGVQGTGGPTIAVDDRLGAQMAVSHLLELGHRRIGYVSVDPSAEPTTFVERFAGYRQALAGAGLLEENEGLTIDAVGSILTRETADTKAAIDALLTSASRPTAIYGADDVAAIEVIERADVLGLRVPEDLSVIGFDDIGMSRLARISLTTVGHPIAELTTRGVETALALAANGADAWSPQVLLEPKLIVRSTTGPAPAPE
jgi:LacI family transcriptional regulator